MKTSRLEAFSDGVLAIVITCYVAVAIMWVIPDRRIDRVVREDEATD